MGHDIYVCLERRHAPSSTWELIAENVYVNRHYTLFAQLAGTHRYDDHAMSLPHVYAGLSADLSYDAELAFARWEKDEDGQPDDLELRMIKTQSPSYGYLAYTGITQVQRIFSETEDDIYELREIAADEVVPTNARVVKRANGLVVVEEKVRRINGLHPDLVAILAYLREYEDLGYRTRMVFGFD